MPSDACNQSMSAARLALRRLTPAPRHRAYTLIELLIVVGLLGLAAALLVPQLVGRDAMAAQACVRLVIADLSFAQSDALAHQEFRRVHFFADGSGYALVRVTEGSLGAPFDPITADYLSDPLARAGTLGRYVISFPEDRRFPGIRITDIDIDGGQTAVTYDQLGGTVMSNMAPGTGGSFVVESQNERYRIAIAPFTGKLTVERL